MAQSRSYKYFGIDRPTLPYKSYTSPIDESPHFLPGSQNVLGSQAGYLEKRPGFSAAIENVLSSVPGTIVRGFTWRRWAGSFYIMLCSVTATESAVYKLEAGTDPSFVQIWQDVNTVEPFDFVVSDNFCFFGNGTTGNMRKFDGTTVTKWGCDAPASAPAVALTQGTLPPGLALAGNVLSGIPAQASTSIFTFTATDSLGATATQTYALTIAPGTLSFVAGASLPVGRVSSAYTGTLAAQGGTAPYGFSLNSGALPAGLALSAAGAISGTPTAQGNTSFAVRVTDAAAATRIQGFSIFVNASALTLTPATLPAAVQSVAYSQVLTPAGGVGPYAFSITGGSLPAGLALNATGTLSGTATVSGPFHFTVLMVDSTAGTPLQASAGYDLAVIPSALTVTTPLMPPAMVGLPYSQAIAVDGGVGPYSYSVSAGAINAQTGYVCGYTYTTIYGHESAMSPLSPQTSLFTSQDLGVTMVASADPQVNGINYYRSTDGGAQDPAIMRLDAALQNVNQTYVDFTPDIYLGLQTGPAFLANTPPVPCTGFVWSNGRIWGKMGNQTYYTGNEEISNGIAEECMPSGLSGNYYSWPAEAGGLAATPEGVDIALAEQWWQISGDTLDTQRKGLLRDRAGAREPINVLSIGGSVVWFDCAKQIWMSDQGEIGKDIRTDLGTLDPARTYVGYHKSNAFNWIYVLDAANGKLLSFDLDLGQWNTPWTVPGMTAIWSGETASGQINLLAAFSTGHVRVFTPATFEDDGADYEDDLRTSLLPITTFSHTTARNRDMVGQVEQFEIEISSAAVPTTVLAITDDDPSQVPRQNWVDLTPFLMPPTFNPEGVYIQRWAYRANHILQPAGRVAFWAQWAAANRGWQMYSLDTAWTELK